MLDFYTDRSGRLFFRLYGCILILTETVPAAPCNIMCSQNLCHLYIIDVQNIPIPLNSAGLICIPVRNAKTATFIVYKSIKRYLPFRAEIVSQFYGVFKRRCLLHAKLSVLVIRDTIDSLMVNTILVITPSACLIVQIRKLMKNTTRKKIILNEAYKPLYGTFCKRMSRFAELGIKADIAHKHS